MGNIIINLKEIITSTKLIIKAHNSNPLMNMVKLQEECGELAEQTILGLNNRQAVIDEIADVVICAIAQGTFISITAYELSEALERKSIKGVAVALAGGKEAYKKLQEQCNEN